MISVVASVTLPVLSSSCAGNFIGADGDDVTSIGKDRSSDLSGKLSGPLRGAIGLKHSKLFECWAMNRQSKEKINPALYGFIDTAAVRIDPEEHVREMKRFTYVLSKGTGLLVISSNQSIDLLLGHAVLELQVTFPFVPRAVEADKMKSIAIDFTQCIHLFRALELAKNKRSFREDCILLGSSIVNVLNRTQRQNVGALGQLTSLIAASHQCRDSRSLADAA